MTTFVCTEISTQKEMITSADSGEMVASVMATKSRRYQSELTIPPSQPAEDGLPRANTPDQLEAT